MNSFCISWCHEIHGQRDRVSSSMGGDGGGLVAKLCLNHCDPMDCSLLGSSIHEISQARILEWVAISFSTGISWPRDQTQVSLALQAVFCISSGFFTDWATREAPEWEGRLGGKRRLVSRRTKWIIGATAFREGNGTRLQYSLPGKSHGRRSLVGCSPWGR